MSVYRTIGPLVIIMYSYSGVILVQSFGYIYNMVLYDIYNMVLYDINPYFETEATQHLNSYRIF